MRPIWPSAQPQIGKGWQGKWQGFGPEKARRASEYLRMREARSHRFKGYEGRYVATDTRTGQVVIADENLKIVLEKVRELDHVVVGGRVPYADEPIYLGLG